MKLRSLALGLLLLAGSAWGADIDGKWSGSLATPNGDFPQNYTFKADGAKLEGTFTFMEGMDIKITEGKIDGNNFSFVLTLDFGGNPFTIPYKGVLSKDGIKLTGDFMGMPLEIMLKKAS
jgi:hypothetical protein